MSIANLKSPASAHTGPALIRSTAAQDVARPTSPEEWYRRKMLYLVAGAVVGLATILTWLARNWAHSGHIVSAQSLDRHRHEGRLRAGRRCPRNGHRSREPPADRCRALREIISLTGMTIVDLVR